MRLTEGFFNDNRPFAVCFDDFSIRRNNIIAITQIELFLIQHLVKITVYPIDAFVAIFVIAEKL